MTHSLRLLFTGFLGEEKWMEFVGVAVVNGFEVIYCSKNSMTAETRQDWVKEVIQYHPTYWFTNECRESQSLLSLNIEALMKSFNHTKGTFLLLLHGFGIFTVITHSPVVCVRYMKYNLHRL